MTFLLPLALLLGFTALFPLIAHALRKGQARSVEFPAAHLVPEKTSSAKQRHRVEDKVLLSLRTLLLFCLAALAASPFVQCSRLSLSRQDGASLAATLIIDDSASMRVINKKGETRLEQSLKSAKQLLAAAQPGDSFAIVLAGKPARVLTPPTTELAGVTEALDSISPSDRETDLASALTLARSLKSEGPHSEHPLVLLSDLASSEVVHLDLTDVVLPELGLQEAFENCSITSAQSGTNTIHVELSCTSAQAAEGRYVELLNEDEQAIEKPVPARDGALRISLSKKNREKNKRPGQLLVRLTEATDDTLDQIPEDDSAPVLRTTASLSIAVRADQEKAGMKTGAGTVIESGLKALDRQVRVEALSIMPDQSAELSRYGALFIDDPSGFTPEVRDALTSWVKDGGVALLLLGAELDRTPLGSDFAPFLGEPPTWSKTDAGGSSTKETGSLGPLSITWAELGASKRAVILDDPKLEAKARWDDGQPLIVERLLGRGLLLTATLPASVDHSDFALRPAFLELLDYVVSQTAIRRGAGASPVGTRWMIAADAKVSGPDGLLLRTEKTEDGRLNAAASEPLRHVEPPLAGRYLIEDSSGQATRFATRHGFEQTRQPQPLGESSQAKSQQASVSQVGVSREIALLALVFSALELAFRLFRPSRRPQTLPKAA